MDVDAVEIEELDESEIPECELGQFEETEPIKYERVISDQPLDDEEEEVLLTKFVNGEVDFPDYYTRLAPDDEYEDSVNSEVQASSSSTFQVEFLTSCRQSLKGNYQGLPAGKTRRKHIMTSVLQSLMGQANLCFARGQNNIAEKLCLEIIRQNPLVPGPFLTLAQIYETKDPEKSLQFATVAAHLSPTDRDQWIRLAEIHIERKNLQQAKSCYSKAIKYNSKDYDLRLRKARLLDEMKDEKAAIFCYYRLIEIIPVEKGELCLETAKRVAQYFYGIKRYKDAMLAMQHAYKLVPSLFFTEEINLYLDLLIMNEEYRTVLRILKENTNTEMALEQDGDELLVVACVIPDDLLPEFRVKLCITLIHLKAFHLFEYIISNVLQFISPETGIDFYVDIVEELIKEQRYSEVIMLLKPLADSKDFTPPPYVWLCYADCYRALKNTDKAIEAYYTVVRSAPNCFDARLTLSALLKQQGKYQDAIKVLEQDMECDPIDPRLLYERCLMLKGIGDLEQYLDVGYLMLLRNSVKFRSREELYLAALVGNRCRKEFIKTILSNRREIDGIENDGPDYVQSDGNLTLDDEYELFKDLMKTAYDLKKFGTMEKFAFTALVSPVFRLKYAEMETMILYSSLNNNDPQIAFEYFRTSILKNLKNNAYWNLYSLLLQKGDDIRYRRFTKRLQSRNNELPLIRLLAANYYLFTGSYKYALNDYMSLIKKISDPIITFGISVTLNQLSGQKNVSRRSSALTHAISFMRKYSDERMSPHTEQEIYYNLGRLYHSCGLVHNATHFYEKGLAVTKSVLVQEHSQVLCLNRELAFNLHLIYKASGNLVMARKYIQDYIVV